MKSKGKTTQSSEGESNLSTIVNKAVAAERSRDVRSLRKALYPVWNDVEKKPQISKLNKQTKAEILRLVGVCLAQMGQQEGDPGKVKRSRALLLESVNHFESGSDAESLSRVWVNLAWGYLQEENYAEAEAVLAHARDTFEGKQTHPLAVAMGIHEVAALKASDNRKKALSRARKVARVADRADDPHLRARFHIDAADLFAGINEVEQASEHSELAVKVAKKFGDKGLLATALSAHAEILRRRHQFESARKTLTKAIAIHVELGNGNERARDSNLKASIFFDEGNYGRALASVDVSLELYGELEDPHGYMSAKYNKARILFKLQDATEALMVFNEALTFAKEHFGESLARQHAKEFSELFYVPGYNDFHGDVAEFKKHILRDALIKSGHYMKQAAGSLKISQANLSDILRRQFPELFSELGIKKRKTRTVNPKK